jgi:type I restriction enzyme S subunit
MANSAAFPKAFGIWFKQADRLDPASFHQIFWHWDKSVLLPLGTVLRLRKEKVDRNKFPFVDLQPITIHFDGSIDKREVDKKRAYTMDLFFAQPGDIIVAKIDLKNGAVGIVPNWKNVVVTNHFAIYEPDLTKLVPEYFHLLIQSSFFKSYLWRNKVGAEGRKEVKLNFLEEIKIPILPVETQRAIVSRWHEAQRAISQAEEKISELEKGIEKQFFADLGLKTVAYVQNLKVFTAHWKDFERWSVSYNQAVLGSIDISKGRHPVVDLGSILSMVQYGSSEKANEKENGVPVLRINNIKNGVFELSDLKHIPLQEKVKRNLLMEDGDILIIRTSGSKDLVGTCAVFHEQEEFVFASYLIRLRVDRARVNPDYVTWLINSRIGRQQIDALSRQIMQSNINSQELRSLKIPLPPLQAQQEIMAHVETGRAEIARQKELAEKIRKDSEAEIEALILGTKKI